MARSTSGHTLSNNGNEAEEDDILARSPEGVCRAGMEHILVQEPQVIQDDSDVHSDPLPKAFWHFCCRQGKKLRRVPRRHMLLAQDD